MRTAERKKNSAVEDPQWTDCDREILFPLRRRNRYKLREMDSGGRERGNIVEKRTETVVR